MLETPEERIRLLKAGISARDIEKLYVIFNDFRVINSPILYEFSCQSNLKKALHTKQRYSMLNSSKS